MGTLGSHRDWQSVARIGALFMSRLLACLASKGPSRVSDRRSDNHSAVPLAVAIAWVLPPRVELTALGSL